MIKTRGLSHFALAVRDAERAFRFYEAVLGAVEVYRAEGWIQAQTPGSHDALVFEEDKRRAGRQGGVIHFGFRLLDPSGIRGAASEIEKAGGTILREGEFCPGCPFVFFRDPDGYEVEIWSEQPTPFDPPDD